MGKVSSDEAASLHGREVRIRSGVIHNRFLDVITVALNQMRGGEEWYTSTAQLQLASFEFCAACRSVTTLALTVDWYNVRSLVDSIDSAPSDQKRKRVSGVPRLRARRVKWNLRSAVELRHTIYASADASIVEIGDDFEGRLQRIVWPHRLQTLEFGSESRFNDRIDGVAWPASFQRITSRGCFNQTLHGVAWSKH